MATEAQRAPSVREQESVVREPGRVAAIAKRIHEARKPAVEYRTPVINDVREALGDLSLQLERLRAVHDLTITEMNDRIVEASTIPPALQDAAYSIWISMMGVSDMLRDLHCLANGITDAAYKGSAA